MFAITQSLDDSDFGTFAAPHAPLRRKFAIRSVAVESAGVEFIDGNGSGPGVRLGKRQRAKAAK